MRRPEFFIVGAPKSGTTFLYERLRDHPRIFVPWMKEPHFFGRDLRFTRERITEPEYLRLFAEAAPDQVVGESSVWYLASKSAAEEILAFAPHARAIILLRNPVDMVRSLHQQLLFSSNEVIDDLRKAVEAEDDRRVGKRIPRSARNQTALLYTEAATYVPQVQRYLRTFGRDRVLIVIYDDLESDQQTAYDGVVEFLGMEPNVRISTERVNTPRSPRVKAVQRFVHKPPGWVSRGARALVSDRQRIRLAEFIQRVNTKRGTQPTALTPETRAWLGERFVEDVQALSALLGRDLSHWIASWQLSGP